LSRFSWQGFWIVHFLGDEFFKAVSTSRVARILGVEAQPIPGLMKRKSLLKSLNQDCRLSSPFLVTGIRQTSPKKLLSSDDHFAKTNQRMPRFHGAQLLGRQKLLAHQAQTAYLYMRITMLSCCAALLKHLKYIG